MIVTNRAQAVHREEANLPRKWRKRGFVPVVYLTRNQSGGGLPGAWPRGVSKWRKTGKKPGRAARPAPRRAPVRNPESRRSGVPAHFLVPPVAVPSGSPPEGGKREGMVEECNIIV